MRGCEFFFFSFTLGERERGESCVKRRHQQKKTNTKPAGCRLLCLDFFLHFTCAGRGAPPPPWFCCLCGGKTKRKKNTLTHTRARGFVRSQVSNKVTHPPNPNQPSRARHENAPEGKDREKNGVLSMFFGTSLMREHTRKKGGGLSAQKWGKKHVVGLMGKCPPPKAPKKGGVVCGVE